VSHLCSLCDWALAEGTPPTAEGPSGKRETLGRASAANCEIARQMSLCWRIDRPPGLPEQPARSAAFLARSLLAAVTARLMPESASDSPGSTHRGSQEAEDDNLYLN